MTQTRVRRSHAPGPFSYLVYASEMAHHAYYVVAKQEEGIERALMYADQTLGMKGQNNPDIVVLRHVLFSVDDARRVIRHAGQTGASGKKVLIITAERVFHEAQNALLKVFEEPPVGTTLILVVPSYGVLIPTLRSRLLTLPGETTHLQTNEFAISFVRASQEEREKIIAKLLQRTKADNDEEKQIARGEALRLVEALTVMAHDIWKKKPDAELTLFLEEMNRFIPILHERSAPLKLIFEHVLLTMPSNLVV